MGYLMFLNFALQIYSNLYGITYILSKAIADLEMQFLCKTFWDEIHHEKLISETKNCLINTMT